MEEAEEEEEEEEALDVGFERLTAEDQWRKARYSEQTLPLYAEGYILFIVVSPLNSLLSVSYAA